MTISTEDHVAISDFLARYCWLVDEGDEDGWVALWAKDAVFTGVLAEPVVGHEALRALVRLGNASGPGKTRHMIANLYCEYQGGRDTVLASYYNFVTNWAQGARIMVMATSRVLLERSGDHKNGGWLIRRNDSVTMPG
jgi:3-phenylpropionate/cinnamic acid dioxygenase small subunit